MTITNYELFAATKVTPIDKEAVVHLIDVDDTLTRKPEGFNNLGMTKDEFFDAARDFPVNQAVADLVRFMHGRGDRIAIGTARPVSRMGETIDWLNRHNIPYDTVMLSRGIEPSGVTKQAMLQQLQLDYRMVGTMVDDSPYNIKGARIQGVDTIELNTNSEYWDAHPEDVWAYGL